MEVSGFSGKNFRKASHLGFLYCRFSCAEEIARRPCSRRFNTVIILHFGAPESSAGQFRHDAHRGHQYLSAQVDYGGRPSVRGEAAALCRQVQASLFLTLHIIVCQEWAPNFMACFVPKVRRITVSTYFFDEQVVINRCEESQSLRLIDPDNLHRRLQCFAYSCNGQAAYSGCCRPTRTCRRGWG